MGKKINIGVIIVDDQPSDRKLHETLSIFGNLLDKMKFNLIYSGKNAGPMDTITKSFYYSGGEVISIITNYMLFTNRSLPYIIKLRDNEEQILESLYDHSDIMVIFLGKEKSVVPVTEFDRKKSVYIYRNKGWNYLNKPNRHDFIFCDAIRLVKELNERY
jgi:hypothetical protein